MSVRLPAIFPGETIIYLICSLLFNIMKHQEMKQSRMSRIDELKGKINFAREACDSFQGKNNYLYQVNSFYLNELRRELEALKKVVAKRY